MYAYLNRLGVTVVSVELPDDIVNYVEFDEIPEGGGIPQLEDGRVIFVQPETLEAPVDPVEELQAENKMLKAQLQAQTDRSDFIEDCIAEMAMVVYGGV